MVLSKSMLSLVVVSYNTVFFFFGMLKSYNVGSLWFITVFNSSFKMVADTVCWVLYQLHWKLLIYFLVNSGALICILLQWPYLDALANILCVMYRSIQHILTFLYPTIISKVKNYTHNNVDADQEYHKPRPSIIMGQPIRLTNGGQASGPIPCH